MSAPLVVREIPETDAAAWDQLVGTSPQGSPFSTSAYLDALCSAA
jgi:hypothetical protein